MVVLDKYLQGNIYTNYFFEGLSSLLTIPIVRYLYSTHRMRHTLIIASLITIGGGFMLLILERAINPDDYNGTYKKIYTEE